MDEKTILALIKWLPIALFVLIFVIQYGHGALKGRRKTVRTFIYVLLFMTVMIFVTGPIIRACMNINIQGETLKTLIDNFIENNETMNDLYTKIPGLKDIIKDYPVSIISLLAYPIFVILGMILCFPIYILYINIFNFIYSKIFKFSKYEKDDKGNYLVNEKGRKLKTLEKKHRISAGLIKGVQGVLVTSTIFVPISTLTRVYNEASNASVSKDLSSIEYLKDYKDILKYVEAYNDSLVGKIGLTKPSSYISNYISKMEIDGKKTNLEKELSNIAISVVYLNDSGIIQVLSNINNLEQVDISKLDIDKLNKVIEMLFDSPTFESLVVDGINYFLESDYASFINNLSDTPNLAKTLIYSSSNEVKDELFRVTTLLKNIVDAKVLDYYKENKDVVSILNKVKYSDMENIVTNVLTVKILDKMMPHVLNKYLKDYGVSNLTRDNNNEFKNVLLSGLEFFKTLELENTSKLTTNTLNNIIDSLYDGEVIKDKSIDSLSGLLANISSSHVFDSLLTSAFDKYLEKNEINLNSNLITSLKTKQEWKNELNMLDSLVKLYDGYNKEKKIKFVELQSCLNKIKDTKVMILALPVAYKTMFTGLGIEVDPNKIAFVEDNDEEGKKEFYEYWKKEVIHLENISNEIGKLELQSMSDITIDLFKDEVKASYVANMFGEVFSSDLLKTSMETTLNNTIKEFMTSYLALPDNSITKVNNLVKVYPYYINVLDSEKEVELKDNNYYIGDTLVTISDNKVSYNGNSYDININSLNRIWSNEFKQMSVLASTLTNVETNYTDKNTITSVLNAVDNMRLLDDCKNDLLIYAVENLNLLDANYITNIKDNKANIVFSDEKNIIINIMDNYSVLSDIASIDFATLDNTKIISLANILDNTLASKIFSDYVADKIVSVANNTNIPLTSVLVKNASSWESDLTLIKNALNMANNFNATSVTTLLNGIETSSLLSPIKESVLIKAVSELNVTGVTINKTLQASDITYSDEKEAIISAVNNLDNLEIIATLDLTLIDIEAIGDLLAKTIKSKFFGESVVNSIASVFIDNGIKHDSETDITNNTSLKNLISGVGNSNNWENELDVIQSMLSVSNSNVSGMFTNIENSSLLSKCKANIMIKAISILDSKDTNITLNTPSVDTLKATGYAQYNKEKEVLTSLSQVSSFSFDSLDGTTTTTTASLLDKMKVSVVLASEYSNIVNTIKDTINGKDDTITISTTFNQNTIIWATELPLLVNIKDSCENVLAMTSTNYDVTVIGGILDNMDNSELISDTSSQNLANKIISNITNNYVTSVSKSDTQTWKEAFESAIPGYGG